MSLTSRNRALVVCARKTEHYTRAPFEGALGSPLSQPCAELHKPDSHTAAPIMRLFSSFHIAAQVGPSLAYWMSDVAG